MSHPLVKCTAMGHEMREVHIMRAAHRPFDRWAVLVGTCWKSILYKTDTLVRWVFKRGLVGKIGFIRYGL